jgi:hypothetical protein
VASLLRIWHILSLSPSRPVFNSKRKSRETSGFRFVERRHRHFAEGLTGLLNVVQLRSDHSGLQPFEPSYSICSDDQIKNP